MGEKSRFLCIFFGEKKWTFSLESGNDFFSNLECSLVSFVWLFWKMMQSWEEKVANMVTVQFDVKEGPLTMQCNEIKIFLFNHVMLVYILGSPRFCSLRTLLRFHELWISLFITKCVDYSKFRYLPSEVI